MARWLGIGRDDLKVDELVLDSESNYSQCHNHNIKNDKDLSSLFSHNSEFSGISDLDNPDKSLLNLLDNQPQELTNNKLESPQDIENKPQRNSQRHKNKSPGTTQEIQDVSPIEKTVIQTDNWQPDLTGWEVSIGLPK
jgi:putative transposase